MGPMNEAAQVIFDSIVKKNPRDLSDDEIKFIHARRPYLNDEQLRVFGDIIVKYDRSIQLKTEVPLYISNKDRAKIKQK